MTLNAQGKNKASCRFLLLYPCPAAHQIRLHQAPGSRSSVRSCSEPPSPPTRTPQATPTVPNPSWRRLVHPLQSVLHIAARVSLQNRQSDHSIMLVTVHKGLKPTSTLLWWPRGRVRYLAHLLSPTALGQTGHTSFVSSEHPSELWPLLFPLPGMPSLSAWFPAGAFILQVSAQMPPPRRGLP